MRRRALGSVLLGSMVLAACASGTDAGDQDLTSASEAIIGSSKPSGPNQVVMLYASVVNANGTLGTRTCSGTYFASRVVVTAAHCLQNVFADQLFVYFGDDFAADFAELGPGPNGLLPPAPGQPSHFAQADSFEQHPDWDATQFYPDLGVVYLDRKLPFSPIPISRRELKSNREVTISGWGANSAPTPTTGAGGRVQRTGKTRTLGSPTLADNHPEDPNPGLNSASNRANLIKTDGRAPYANGCFGDSGGPILIEDCGQTYVAGIDYFGGLSCQDYSLYVRPNAFLPFLDRAEKKGSGTERLKPVFDCVAPNPEGSLTAFFGYQNDNGVSVSLPYGGKNKLALDSKSQRPTRFMPGQHDFSFGVDFSGRQSVSWTLHPDGGKPTTLTVDASSRRCGAEQAAQSECALACRASGQAGCADQPTFDSCVSTCLGTTQFVIDIYPYCLDQNSALNACTAALSSDPANWLCLDGIGVFPGDACQAQNDALSACFSM
ncbi:MAG TPA: trypsin-like serine protease [Polyangiaceae bacterium]|nr:trypsin-like serine protease [Polyangiaceae bacterium]